MGKAVGGVPEAPALSAEAGDDAGIGAYLATQRRLRGIGLDELAARTRIPRRSLERLESGAFDGPPDGFVRGFVRTVALAIGLDPDDAVTRMLAEPEARRGPHLPSLRRVALVGVALLLLLALGTAVSRLVGRPGQAEAAAAPTGAPLPVRRDHVRALAAEEGVLPATPPPAAAPTPPPAAVPTPAPAAAP
jgi:hypothetical protein